MKFDLKSMVVGIIIGSIGLTSVYAAAKDKNIDVYHNISDVFIQNESIIFDEDHEPFICNGVTYVPLRIFAENMGCEVSFKSPENSIFVYNQDKSKTRLMEEAVSEIGAPSPERAIDIWSKGLIKRSAALQYIVMTESLKEKYVKSLEENQFNFWVTGISSPWVEDYELLKTNKLNDNEYEYKIMYNTKTSDQSYHFIVTLKVVKDDGYWKIADVSGDEESGAYTGFIK